MHLVTEQMTILTFPGRDRADRNVKGKSVRHSEREKED